MDIEQLMEYEVHGIKQDEDKNLLYIDFISHSLEVLNKAINDLPPAIRKGFHIDTLLKTIKIDSSYKENSEHQKNKHCYACSAINQKKVNSEIKDQINE